MPDRDQEHHNTNPPQGDTLLLRGPLSDSERQEKERQEYQKERDRKDDAYKDGQIAIERGQLKSNNRIAIYTLVLAFLTAVGTLVSFLSSQAAKESAYAAKSAAETAAKTLNQMTGSSKESSAQVGAVIDHLNSVAASMKDGVTQNRRAVAISAAQNKTALDETIKQNKESLAATLAQSQKTLDSSLLTLRLENRPWVSFGPIKPDPFKVDTPIRFHIIITNTGKTPARKFHTVTFAFICPPLDPFVTPTDVFTSDIPSESTLHPGGSSNTSTLPIYLRPSDVARLKIGTRQIRVLAVATYEDVFGDPHYTKFCVWYDTNTSEGGAACPAHNDQN